MTTSQSDRTDYRTCCIEAPLDSFRQRLEILEVVDNEQDDYAAICWPLIADNPLLANKLVRICEIDAIGDPPRLRVPLTPSFTRYAKIACDLHRLFGDLAGFIVNEIGGGYGGQAAVIAELFSVACYSLVDLPEVMQLQSRYLDAAVPAVPVFRFIPIVSRPLPCDLLLSNYAFSEIRREYQHDYVKHVIKHASRGYMVLTEPFEDYGSYTAAELQEITGGTLLPEEPQTNPTNQLLVWGQR